MIIGLDVGGTHTDAVLLGREGIVQSVKVATDPERLFDTVINALEQLTVNQDVDAVSRVVLSTTLATNMVVQDKLPDVAMLVAAGPGIDPEYFRVCEHYYTVTGALDHSGRQIEPLDEGQLREIGERLKADGVRYAGVVSKFSVRNPGHEQRMAEIIAPYVEDVFMGHTLSGSLSFPRRISTTYLNAAVYPTHRKFFEAVHASLEAHGINVPIRLLKPDGGNMNMAASLTYPAQTILSGPSASVMGAIASAPQDKTCLVLDIGGTTTDMAVILNGVPIIAQQGIKVGAHKTLIRALLTQSIGIGGDSVVRLNGTSLTIGPDRQGVAMAYGGPKVTPTDALCILGLTDDGDRALAERGIAELAGELGLTIQETAELIFDTACRAILSSAGEMIEHINSRPVYTVHEMYEGLQLEPDHLLVLGGPGKQFADRLSSMFSGGAEPVPNWQVANAIGCALARTTCEVTVYADTSRKVITAQGEEFHGTLPARATLQDVRNIAFELVRKKAVDRGANPGYLQMEVIEESQFNMVRGFRTTGKNIRVRAQVKPGLIHGYDRETGKLSRDDL